LKICENLVSEIVYKIKNFVGDRAKTIMVLAQTIVVNCLKNVSFGSNLMGIHPSIKPIT
jgi:chaperonin GroEL (HSP60 family)